MVSSNAIRKEQAFADKRVVILGLARQGKALARFFAHAGASVTVSDLASADQLAPECQELDGLSIRYVLGEHPLTLLDDCDLLCLSGGVPPQLPIVQEAVRRGIPLSNDSLLTLQMARTLGLGPVVAITGSSGKTTTTTLVGQMLEAAGYVPHVGGNIGAPLLDRLGNIYAQEPLVLELSSFQLELFDPQLAFGDFADFGPQVATLLNITPNHLDRHPSMAAYAAAKLNLLRQMPPGASLILNWDDPVSARLMPDVMPDAPARTLSPLPAKWQLDGLLAETRDWIRRRDLRVIPFSRLEPLEQGAWLEDGRILLDGEEICRRDEVLLLGEHNISNLLAALATVAGSSPRTETSNGRSVAPQSLAQVATSFTGVAHRLEIVADDQSVVWINDSIATSPERALAGLHAVAQHEETIILLAGGKDKNLPWDDFANAIVEQVDFLIGFGHHGPSIVGLVQDRARYRQQKAPNCAVVQRLEEAVGLAGRIAQPKTIVLLSPGGTSYDMYRDFEARGEHFRQLVQNQMVAARNKADTPGNGTQTHEAKTNGSQYAMKSEPAKSEATKSKNGTPANGDPTSRIGMSSRS